MTRALPHGPGVRVLLAAKALLVALLLTGALFPSVGGFEGKGMAYRLPLFAAPSLVIPWRWWRTGSWNVGIDAALTVPFLLDTLGNALGFYDRFDVTDDVLHFVNWVVLVWGVTTAVAARDRETPRLVWLTGTSVGALAIVGWEIAEYEVMRAGVGGLSVTYADTVGDLALSTLGGGLGALLAVRRSMRRSSAR